MRSDRRPRAQLVVAISTALLAIVAGAAIAGLLGDQQAGDVVVSSPAPDSTDTGSPTSITAAPVAAPTTSYPLPSTTETTSTTAPTSTTVPAPTTVTTSTTSTTSTTVPTSTTVTTSTEPRSTTTDGGPLPRAELDVATANASGVDGVAGAAAERLLEIGYSTVSAINAFSPQETSVVYHQPNLLAEAVRLAVDLGWASEAVAPVDEMPALDSQQVLELVAVIGIDRARA